MSKHQQQHPKTRKIRAYHVYLKPRGLAPIIPDRVLRYGNVLRKKISFFVSILLLIVFTIFSRNFRCAFERAMPHKEAAYKLQKRSQLTDVETIRYSYSDKLPRKPGRYVVYTATNSEEENTEIEENINDGYVHPYSRVINIDSLHDSYEYSNNDNPESRETDSCSSDKTSIHKPEKPFIGHSSITK